MKVDPIALQAISEMDFTEVPEVYAKMPESVNRAKFSVLIGRLASDLKDYDLDNTDIEVVKDQLSDPNRDYPYTNDKWNLLNELSLWASADLTEVAEEYCDTNIDNGRQRTYIEMVMDGYIYATNQWALDLILSVITKEVADV